MLQHYKKQGVMPLGLGIEEESTMFDVDEVPFPKPRRLRLRDERRVTPVPFPIGPLKGAKQKKGGAGAFSPQA